MTHAIASVLAFAAGVMWRFARRAHAELHQLDDQEVADMLTATNGLGMALRLSASPVRGLLHVLTLEGDQ